MTGLVAQAALILALGAAPDRYEALAARPAQTGFVVRYNPGVMERVARNRGIARRSHMAAYTYATDRDIGRLWLHIEGPAGAADFLVVDLPRPGKDKQELIARGVIAELDYWSGAIVCGPRWTGRARDCRVRVSLIE